MPIKIIFASAGAGPGLLRKTPDVSEVTEARDVYPIMGGAKGKELPVLFAVALITVVAVPLMGAEPPTLMLLPKNAFAIPSAIASTCPALAEIGLVDGLTADALLLI